MSIAHGTLVYADDRVVPIEEIAESVGRAETFEVRTNRGLATRVTADHAVLTARGSVAAGDLRACADCPVEKRAPRYGDEVRALDAAPQVKTALDPRDALLLGALTGDGWREPNGLGFVWLRSDAAAWEPMIKYAGELFGSIEKAHDQKASRTSRILWRNKGARAFRDAWLVSKDFVPAPIWTSGARSIGAYLSGLFSTDGHVGRRTNSSGELRRSALFSQVRPRLVSEMRLLLRMLGIVSTAHVSHRSREEPVARGCLAVGRRRDIYTIQIAAVEAVKLFADRVGFVEPRKQDALVSALTTYDGYDTTERVRSVRPVGVSHVYPMRGGFADGLFLEAS